MIDGAPRIASVPAYFQFVAGGGGTGQIQDLRRRVVDQKRIADQGRSKRLIGRVAGRIRCRHPQHVLTVGERGGVPAQIPILHVLLEKLPSGLLNASNFHAIDQRVVVFVRRQPASSFEAFRVVHRLRRGAFTGCGRAATASLLPDGRKRERRGRRDGKHWGR